MNNKYGRLRKDTLVMLEFGQGKERLVKLSRGTRLCLNLGYAAIRFEVLSGQGKGGAFTKLEPQVWFRQNTIVED